MREYPNAKSTEANVKSQKAGDDLGKKRVMYGSREIQ